MEAGLLAELSTLPADQPTKREACHRCRYLHRALYSISIQWLAKLRVDLYYRHHIKAFIWCRLAKLARANSCSKALYCFCCVFIADVHFVCASVTAFPVSPFAQTHPSLSYSTPTRYTHYTAVTQRSSSQ